MNDITIDNVLEIPYEDLHKYVFGLVEVHVDYLSIDQDKFTYLLGYYPAIYNYLSELYAFLINQVRVQMELNDKFTVARYRDKRDMLEQALKSVKFQYDSLSRKITLLAPNLSRGDEF